MPEVLIVFEPGDTPGNPPRTPPERQEEARRHLELLLSGWERAVADADVSPNYRQIVMDMTERTRGALEAGTTPYYLIATVLSAAFVLPDELEVTGLTEELATYLGMDLEQAKGIPRIYPSLFDLVDQARLD